MKKKSILSAVLILAFVFAALLPASPAQAAKKKTVYVLTKISSQNDGQKMTYRTYKYNKKGLVKSGTYGNGNLPIKYSYDKKDRIKTYQTLLNEWHVRKYTYGKKGKGKGRITKLDAAYNNASNQKFAYDGFHSVYTYNKKKQVVKEKATGEIWDDATEKNVNVTYDIRYSYNKKGLMTRKENKTTGEWVELTYDKKKNLTRLMHDYADGTDKTTFKNKYKKGRLVSREESFRGQGEDMAETITYTFTYKKMKVNKKYADQIQAQQWALINKNFSHAIPDNNYFSSLY